MDSIASTRKNELNDSIGYINRLTLEILTIIFSYLPLSDRKSTRLVCRQWLAANNVKRFLSREKLLCTGLYELDAIIEILQDSERQILNLEFHNLQFDDFSRSRKFWKISGHKIETLLFSNCIVTDGTMKNVIRYCKRLKSLTLEDLSSPYARTSSYPKITCFDDPTINSRSSLRSLKLSVYSISQISDDLLVSLAEIFPNMREFSFQCVEEVDNDFFITCKPEYMDRSSDMSKCTDVGFVQFLSDLDHLKLESVLINDSSEFHLLFDVSYNFIVSRPKRMPMLKEVKLGHVLCHDEDEEIIKGLDEFLKFHEQLQSVNFVIHGYTNVSISAAEEHTARVMTCLLDSCPLLRKLEIFLYNDDEESCPRCICLDATTSAKLVKCGLKELIVNFNMKISLPSNVEMINSNLRSLEIFCPLKDDFFLSLCRTFRGLTHLMVTYMNDDSLQNIWKYQQNLTSLQLINFQNCTDYGFIGSPARTDDESTNQSQKHSIREMQKLKYLELSMCACHDGNEPKITEKTFQELKFPGLSYLRVTINVAWKLSTDFVRTFSNHPNLEGLNCIFYKEEPIDYAVWSELCSKLPELKFMNILFKQPENFGDGNYERLFKVCPKLRMLQTRLHLYYYDIIKKRVAKNSSRKKYPLGLKDLYPYAFL